MHVQKSHTIHTSSYRTFALQILIQRLKILSFKEGFIDIHTRLSKSENIDLVYDILVNYWSIIVGFIAQTAGFFVGRSDLKKCEYPAFFKLWSSL